LAALLLALRDTLIEEPLLYLCDKWSLWNAVDRCIGEGGKATLVGAPDADILAAAIDTTKEDCSGDSNPFSQSESASKSTSE